MQISFSFRRLALWLLPVMAGPMVLGQSIQVQTIHGTIEGTLEKSGVHSFKGIPYAAPPVGELRWKAPQPALNWTGVRKADHFGPRAMQPPIYSDMVFRSDGMSEDCLYLNVWVPGNSAAGNSGVAGNSGAAGGTSTAGGSKGLPVLVYFYGGGFMAGDGSEPRYDGESMATKGIISLTVNYRLGLFGLFAHPELTQESPNHASGNYGLMDQAAALQWVQDNIAAFGGDPKRVTIAGESAGSSSVSALMATPLTKGLFAGAIGESGSVLGTNPPTSLSKAEQTGVDFAKAAGANSLADLRAMPADQLMAAATKAGTFHFGIIFDGYFFPKAPLEIFSAHEQACVPLLLGWNSEEGNYKSITGGGDATVANYEAGVRKLYAEDADTILRLYHAAGDADVKLVGNALASDRFIGFSTWRWAMLQAVGCGQPVYRYFYGQPRPATVVGGPAAEGASHSAEIEYAMGNLPGNKVYAWTKEDYKVSTILQGYFLNFVKKGDPNGPGLPHWVAANAGKLTFVQHIGVKTRTEPAEHEDRYWYIDGKTRKSPN